MFPSLLIQPETHLFSMIVGYTVFGVGLLLHRIRLVISILAATVLLLIPQSSKALMAMPGGCGSVCMSQGNVWGYPFNRYPQPVYMYPYLPNPYQFYGSPYSYFPMLPPWYGGYGGQSPMMMPPGVH